MSAAPDFGALVISLDLELHWGMRDHRRLDAATRTTLLRTRAVIPRLLDLFDEFAVSATWATVGFLFAHSRDELQRHRPLVRPQYDDPILDPYDEEVGRDERDDPFHYAPSLLAAIRARPTQEIATHTFSHYYCLEPMQRADAFEADVRSAVAIAEQAGVRLRSIVFPRNQVNPAYAAVLRASGLEAYRGTPSRWMYRPSRGRDRSPARRGARLLDAYAGRSDYLTPWEGVRQPNGLFDVPASLFLRPWSGRTRRTDSVRLQRAVRMVRAAAAKNAIVHLWSHPDNFAARPDESLAFLRAILEEFARQRDDGRMRSLAMAGVVDALRVTPVTGA